MENNLAEKLTKIISIALDIDAEQKGLRNDIFVFQEQYQKDIKILFQGVVTLKDKNDNFFEAIDDYAKDFAEFINNPPSPSVQSMDEQEDIENDTRLKEYINHSQRNSHALLIGYL